MRRNTQEHDVEAPLLDSSAIGSGSSADVPGGTSSRGLSPNRTLSDGEEGRRTPRTVVPGGSIRLKRTSTVPQDDTGEQGGLVVKDVQGDGDVRELEVEVVAGAVAEAVAEAVQDAVQEAVHDAVQQALEENVSFDVRANLYTLVAVTGVILFWRGVWNSWDSLFGTALGSNIGSMAVGMAIMLVIRFFNLPLVEGLPGG